MCHEDEIGTRKALQAFWIGERNPPIRRRNESVLCTLSTFRDSESYARPYKYAYLRTWITAGGSARGNEHIRPGSGSNSPPTPTQSVAKKGKEIYTSPGRKIGLTRFQYMNLQIDKQMY